jgi:nitrite reductase/ring-hydroxylating ferredoxin subunit
LGRASGLPYNGEVPTLRPIAHAAGRSQDIPEKGRLVVDLGEHTIGIFRVEGRLYAYENTCPHQGGPVCQGLIIPAVREVLTQERTAAGYAFDESDMRIVCPWHGYEFSIATGTHPGCADVRLRSFPVYEENGVVYVSL